MRQSSVKMGAEISEFPNPQEAGPKAKNGSILFGTPFQGRDVGQVPLPERPDRIRLFQVKSRGGPAKGGDGKRRGEAVEAFGQHK